MPTQTIKSVVGLLAVASQYDNCLVRITHEISPTFIMADALTMPHSGRVVKGDISHFIIIPESKDFPTI